MTTTVHASVELAATWRLLSLGFAPPTEETLAEVDALVDALVHGGPAGEVFEVARALRTAPVETHGTQFAALFGGTVRVAPYEGSYELDPIRQGRQMADVAAFYRAFGAEAHGPHAERPDFVGCELEFLSFLELRRLAALEAGEDGVDVLDGFRDAFLADHAGRWLPTFFEEVAREAPARSLYAALAALGARTLADELERRGVDPSPLPARVRSAVETDTFACGGSAA